VSSPGLLQYTSDDDLAPTRNLQQGGEASLASMHLDSSAGFRNPLSTFEYVKPWNKRDQEDASRLGVMMGGFLKAEPFGHAAVFREKVTAHLLDHDGPRFGAVQRLKYLMNSMMVKHRYISLDTTWSYWT
jgi:hypothetical protein